MAKTKTRCWPNESHMSLYHTQACTVACEPAVCAAVDSDLFDKTLPRVGGAAASTCGQPATATGKSLAFVSCSTA